MELKNIYNTYKQMTDDYTLFSFKGIVNKGILDSLFSTIETKLKIIETSVEKRKKIYNILVECLQNLYHHGEQIPYKDTLEGILSKSILLLISKKDTQYHIKTGNYISRAKSEELKKRLEDINNMTEKELRDFHNNILKSGERTEKGTAGLGLIDIARKSNNKLNYEFIPVDEKYDFFCLGIRL
jgi:hypothetical protein